MNKRIIILGPAHPFRGGGITTFNERMALEFQEQGNEVTIYNFTLQYPSFLFPGKTQYATTPAPKGIHIVQRLNSINPFNWWKVGKELRLLQPDIIIVRFWLPFMGPAFGTVLRCVRKNKHTRIIAITDNVIPHEKRIGDIAFTKYFLGACDAFITMSKKVMNDLQPFIGNKPAIEITHPLYDNFGAAIDKVTAREILQLNNNDQVLLFFGFIRKYKGLDILLDAIALLISNHELPAHFKLVIAGEFYENEAAYMEKINTLQLAPYILLKNDFIKEEDVKNYFCAADGVIQPYRNATQSGVTPLAYHFEIPMIVTNVGALPDYVPDNIAGLVCEPNAPAMAMAIKTFFQKEPDFYLPGVQSEKKKYSWKHLVNAIDQLYKRL